ncbi:MAG: type I restriction endonuclease, partial [Methanoculleus sp.]
MSNVGERERLTQERVVAYFRDTLKYRYLGDWEHREGNSNVEEALLAAWLTRRGHNEKIVGKVLYELGKAKAVGGNKSLYDANREVYGLLRYGVKVRPDIGEQHITVWLIDWDRPEKNDFAVAEEVTIAGENSKRPDIVLYVNGIALCVLELKRSIVSVSEGVRQNLDNQKKIFIRPVFSTVQLVMAGNETEGLRYGVIETPEKYYLRWKEADAGESPLLRELFQLCRKDRLLEIVHDFIVFDAGTKKTCRHNQYFGVKAAQERVKRREGGIIWHTQGSGKSLIMVWLAKWIREHVPAARVLLVTDRTELDDQIEKVFLGVSEDIYRTRSGADLVRVLNTDTEWLVCSLVHKFGRGDDLSDADLETYIEEIKRNLP